MEQQVARIWSESHWSRHSQFCRRRQVVSSSCTTSNFCILMSDGNTYFSDEESEILNFSFKINEMSQIIGIYFNINKLILDCHREIRLTCWITDRDCCKFVRPCLAVRTGVMPYTPEMCHHSSVSYRCLKNKNKNRILNKFLWL